MKKDIHYSALISLLYFLIGIFTTGSVNQSIAAKEESTANSKAFLSVEKRYNIPIKELSGLTLIKGDSNSIDIYGVGDSSYNIGRVRFKSSSGEVTIDKYDLVDIVKEKDGHSSQWEAIAADGKGSLCILAEVTSNISCFDKDISKEQSRFRLDVSTISSLEKLWEEQPNSRGEGMILMKKGHVLILKEKNPLMLIEFGPRGDTPMGYNEGLFLERGEELDQPKLDDLVALKSWDFSNNLAILAKDASDITVGPDSRVYILSDESAILIRLEKILKPDEAKIHASAYWKLPKEIEKAEGLVIDNEMHPWIGIDIKQERRPNLFRLSRINTP